MKFVKKHLDDIVRCYCASHMMVDDKLVMFFASENPTSPCYAYSGDEFEDRTLVWDDRGGCMSIIPFPTRKNEFFAVNEFYLKVTPSLSKIVWGKFEDGKVILKDVLHLPYLHRFDIYHVDGKDYFICGTIARNKENKEDWSLPGQIYVGEIPEDLSNGFEVTEILDGCYRNHGYSRGMYNDRVCGYFASDQGVVRVEPPVHGGEWTITKIKEGMTSEIAFQDLDGDGVEEMITIEPFHGNTIKIYKNVHGVYEEVYKYPYELDFAHALVGTTLAGKPCFVGGIRRVNAELFVITYEDGEYKLTIVEKGVGPANVDVVHYNGKEYILSANHTLNEAAFYEVLPD